MCVVTCCGGRGCGGCCSCLTCCFPLRGCVYFFVVLSFLLQLAMCLFFLLFEVWYVFIGVAVILLSHLYFIFVSRGRNFFLLHLFSAYSSLWSLIYVGLFVWSAVIEIWPDSDSPMWHHCYAGYYYDDPYTYPYDDNKYYDCRDYVRSMGWVLMIESLVAAIVQGYTSRLLFAYKKWLELQAVKNRLDHRHSQHSPHVTVITNTPVYTIQPPSAAPYQPPPPPPPPPSAMQPPVSAVQYPQTGTPYPQGNALLPPQSSAVLPTAPPVSPVPTPDTNRRTYPEVPSSSSHLEAPPPYAAAVGEGEKGGAYQNYGYQQKY
ncbi:hypothetical protein PMAYCL1PPCAC_23175 [Pristionchus mayeri]|uniref:Uncharacterized protein n=1 Tax=Pristionchus mayeri TaxID=1317129 RepID=A0AAN5I6C7_9BILA|nr:hypothetical protein PMAYCL1PPCAC_23175 [Pristionchus mayeri]